MTDFQVEKIKDRVIRVRKHLGLNQKQFGKSLKYSQSFISEMESGAKEITERFLKSVSNEYNINYDWLVGGVGEMEFMEIRNKSDHGDIKSPDDSTSKLLELQDKLIKRLEEENERLTLENEKLVKECNDLRSSNNRKAI